MLGKAAEGARLHGEERRDQVELAQHHKERPNEPGEAKGSLGLPVSEDGEGFEVTECARSGD